MQYVAQLQRIYYPCNISTVDFLLDVEIACMRVCMHWTEHISLFTICAVVKGAVC